MATREISLGALVKLASIMVHAEEILDNWPRDVHPLDIEALKSLLNDPEVMQLRAELDSAALLPKKRR